jgi:hypothetical protein
VPEVTFAIGLWALRILFVLLVYLLLFQSIGALQRSLASAPVAQDRSLAYLVVTASPKNGARGGERYPLRAVTSLGRDPGNDVVLQDDFTSARHSVVSFDGSQWWVEDAGSTNGTYVNGEQIDGRTPLHFGDEVEVGRMKLRLEQA